MILRTNEIAAAVDGEVLGEVVEADGASIDSRAVRSGQLFVPIIAERDGHDFIDAALAAGAAAYLTSRPDGTGQPAVAVTDTSSALMKLGHLARSRLPDRVVGITGSVGKTSTKDLLASVLATTWETAANPASFNNELGVPLTLLEAPAATEAVICEMGARGIGHIALLCDIARPTVGVVTAVHGAHLEMFGSIEAVARAKTELVAALPASGSAVLNMDQPLVAAMAGRTSAAVVRVGMHGSDLDVTASQVTIDGDLRAHFTLESAWGSAPVALAARGAHQVSNALCAAGAGLALGLGVASVAAGLSAGVISPMRMALARRDDGLVVLDDSYNANPTSMVAALDALAALEAQRRIAVVGIMAELGRDEADGHLRVARHASSLGITLISVGTDLYGSDVAVVRDVPDAVTALGGLGVGDGDAVLVKASRVVGLERVAAALLTPS